MRLLPILAAVLALAGLSSVAPAAAETATVRVLAAAPIAFAPVKAEQYRYRDRYRYGPRYGYRRYGYRRWGPRYAYRPYRDWRRRSYYRSRYYRRPYYSRPYRRWR